jgi:hypothetical protein
MFAYLSFGYKKVLKLWLQQRIAAVPPDQTTDAIVSRVSPVLPLLEQHCSTAQKSSIVSVLSAIWNVRPLFMPSTNLQTVGIRTEGICWI